MLKTVKLYGHLGKKFGREFRFDVRNPAEAICALRANCPGFLPYLGQHDQPGYWVFTGRENRGLDQLRDPMGSRESIKIVPVIAGGGGSIFKIIGGEALSLFGVFTGNLFLAQLGSGIALAGAIGGIASLIFSPPKPGDPQERPENKPGFSFNGPINTTKQGQPVPILYGKLMVGSAVISSGISSEEK